MKLLGNNKMADIKKRKFSWGTRTEAAKRLGISRPLLNSRIKNNDLDAIKMVVKVEKEKILKEKELGERADRIISQLANIGN